MFAWLFILASDHVGKKMRIFHTQTLKVTHEKEFNHNEKVLWAICIISYKISHF